MKENLDRWIKDAKDEVPDSGEYRRLNRVLLKERMLSAGPGHRRQHRVLLVSVILIFLLLISGQFAKLGGDGFNAIIEDWVNSRGETIPVLRNEFRGNTFTAPKDFTSEDLDELNHALAAGDGELLAVWGISYGGKTSWIKYVKRMINGKIDKRGESPQDRPAVEPDNYQKFLETHMREIVQKTKILPAQREALMTFDGIPCKMQIWVFHFPDYGEVLRFKGVPVEEC